MSTPASSRPSLDVQYYQRQHGPKRPKRPRGRWFWAISGAVMIVALWVPVTAVLSRPHATRALPMRTVTHVVPVSEPVTSLSVQSYGGNVAVIGGNGSVQVTEQVAYDPQQGPAPAVTDVLSHGQLTLTVPACASQNCLAAFTVTVPSTVSVTAVTDGGDVAVSGVAGATLDSGGGNVAATSVHGPLTIASEDGNQDLLNIGGPLDSESGDGNVAVRGVTAASAIITTDGGQLAATGVAAQTVVISSGGGDAQIGFSRPPSSVDVTTDGGNATVLVPGGPYATTADSGGGPEVVGIATSPAARASLTVITGSGSLTMLPASASAVASISASASAWAGGGASFGPHQNANAVFPPAPLVPLAPAAPRAAQ